MLSQSQKLFIASFLLTACTGGFTPVSSITTSASSNLGQTSTGGGTTTTTNPTNAHGTDGTCGTAADVAVFAIPTSSFCATGTPTSITGVGPWTWTCSGVSGGADSSPCVTPLKVCAGGTTQTAEGTCVTTTIACPATALPAHATTGSETYTSGAYGACMATACSTGYTLLNNACVATTIACPVLPTGAATGTETLTGGTYGACQITSCLAGYNQFGNSCSYAPPVVTQWPAQTSLTEFTGQSVSFSVAATGSQLTYQWYKSGVAIPGATSAIYTISPITLANDAYYGVSVSNPGGTLNSPSQSSVAFNVGESQLFTTSILVYQTPTGADLSTIHLVDANHGFTADSSHVYYYDTIIPGASPATFSETNYHGAYLAVGNTLLCMQARSFASGVHAVAEPVPYAVNIAALAMTLSNGAYPNYVTDGNLYMTSAPCTVIQPNNIGGYTAPDVIMVEHTVGTVVAVGESQTLTVDTSKPDICSLGFLETFQWSKDGVTIPCATTHSIAISATSAAQAGWYTMTETSYSYCSRTIDGSTRVSIYIDVVSP